jgi:methylmalonyl-CoA/ethylmalonyl-CoA epimerase
MKVDHIGIAVEDLVAAKRLYGEVLGLRFLFEEEVPTERVRVAAYDGGGVRIELLETTSPDGPIGRHLASRGPGIHHVCYEVPDVAAALDRLRANGVRTIDTVPRPGAGGCRVAFVHPKGAGGVLVELSQHPPGGPRHHA